MISVIVPTRGRPQFLRRALASVVSQDISDYEIVVVDDGEGEGAAVAASIPGARSLLTGGAGQVAARRLGVEAARGVLSALRAAHGHRFLADDVSLSDHDVPRMTSHRQVADAHLLTLARRRGVRLLTFDAGLVALAEGRDVELLTRL